MQTNDLDFPYPQELVAVTPSRPSRVAFSTTAETEELSLPQLLQRFRPGDILVLNESKVIPARVFSRDEIEVLFLRANTADVWQVLFPARDLKIGDTLELPGDLTLTLTQKGLPQTVKLSHPIDLAYFERHGEVALPPYIQEARQERHNRREDGEWYQTAWARAPGSVAAPTASLHFTQEDLAALSHNGVDIAYVTLHVGAGTFLPVRAANLSEHTMHAEWATVPAETRRQIGHARARGGRVWALGTTVARTLESQAGGLLKEQIDGAYVGETRLFIYPPYEFKAVDVLLTNFHQPKSTLFGLVAAFAGLERARQVYAWAIERRFQLFSYGDLSVWTRTP
jgi:S-adenosylmethionine:tRNA ribosyltransferase-isomerase